MQKILRLQKLKKTSKDFKGLEKTAKDIKGLQKILKDYKRIKKNDKDCQRYLSKLFRTIRQLYFSNNWAIQTVSPKLETTIQYNNTTTKKRSLEGCASTGAALKTHCRAKNSENFGSNNALKS